MCPLTLLAFSSLAGEIYVDSLCGSFACAHGQDDRSCAGDSVAARKDAFLGGLAVAVICYDTFAAVDIQSFGCGGDQRVGGSAQGHDDCVALDLEFGAGNLYGSASAGLIGLAQFHTQAGDALDPAVFIRVDLHRVGQKVENDSLFLCVQDFLTPCGKLLFTSAVYDVGLGAQTKCRSCSIHCNVSAADDDCLFGLS